MSNENKKESDSSSFINDSFNDFIKILIANDRDFDDEFDDDSEDESETFSQEQFLLGMRYLYGDGVEKDSKKAIEYLTNAAEHGHGDSRLAEFLAGRLRDYLLCSGDENSKPN